MCTAATYQTGHFYFGRNLDLDYNYRESVTVTPRAYPFEFRCGTAIRKHFALIGMATVESGYPLYYDATNEHGLSMAGLNFPKNAVYYPYVETKENIAPFELIPWLLGQCADTDEAEVLLRKLNLWNEPFSDAFPLSALHWILADRKRCLVLEPMENGMQIYNNPIGILTNNPPFEFHMHNLAQYMNLTVHQPENRFSDKIKLEPFSLGMGSVGLPGDMSSPSRFVKAAFTKLNSFSDTIEEESISQFFHILGSVVQQRGLTETQPGKFEYTLYSSCCNTDKGIYYYRTYDNSQINAVDMHKENLDGVVLATYPLITRQKIKMQN